MRGVKITTSEVRDAGAEIIRAAAEIDNALSRAQAKMTEVGHGGAVWESDAANVVRSRFGDFMGKGAKPHATAANAYGRFLVSAADAYDEADAMLARAVPNPAGAKAGGSTSKRGSATRGKR